MDVTKILDDAKTGQGLTTDSELASALGVTKQAVSNWRKGVSLPDTVTCATLAGLTGMPLAKVLGIVGEARAISRDEKAVWRKLAATAALLAVVLFPALPSHAQAVREAVSDSPGVCIMRNYRDGLWWAVKYLQLWLKGRFCKPRGPSIEALSC